MTAASGFDLHPEAARDIITIWETIASNNPSAAGRVREDIVQGIRNLVSFPHSGHRRPDLTGRPLRFTRVRDYLIAYASDEDPLWIVAVIHGHRPRWTPQNRPSIDTSKPATTGVATETA